MTRYFFLFAVILLAIIAASSCQKEFEPGSGAPTSTDTTTTTTGDTSLLRKFIVLDTTQTAPADTQYIFNYTYDALKRCTVIKKNDYQNNIITYTYNAYAGTDTLIASRKVVTPALPDSIQEFFTYSASGQMLADSVVESSGGSYYVYTYQVNGNAVTAVINLQGQPFMKGAYAFTKDAVGNIIAEKDTGYKYDNTTNSYYENDTLKLNFAYDTKPCPFYKMYPHRLVETDFENVAEDDFGFYYGIMQQYNIVSEMRTGSSSGISAFNAACQYTYKANGYPATVIYKDLLYGDVYKGIYFYQ